MKKRIKVIVILMEYVGRHDYSVKALADYLKEYKRDLQYASICEYLMDTREEFEAFTSGMAAVQSCEEYAYVWEDENSPEYETQHKEYETIRKILEDYI